MSSNLGPLVRLTGLTLSQLPPGGRGTSSTTSAGSAEASHNTSALKTFFTSLLRESLPFLDSLAPKSSASPNPTPGAHWKRKMRKVYPNSEAPVDVFERVVLGSEIDAISGMDQLSADKKNETWFTRRSCHRDCAEPRTANWAEFENAFKDDHPGAEDAFTASILGARTAVSWDTKNLQVEVGGEIWGNFTMAIVETKHKIDPKPLKNRTFPVLQVTTARQGTREFIVVSIPITDFEKSPHADYAQDKSLVIAWYVSIERIRVLPQNGQIEWIMGTASDACGVLPQWIQNLAVPGKIAHDVDMFLTWIPSQRKERGVGKPNVARQTTFDKSLPPAPATSDRASMGTVPPPPISKTEAPPPMTRAESANKVLPAAPVQ
jgi:hypothetical protein